MTIGVFVGFIACTQIIGQAPEILLIFLLYGLFLAFGYYCWDVVYSVYRDLKAEEENTAVHVKFHNKV